MNEDFDDEENEITECPNCGRTYDDADADFLICHHCGWDAEEKRFKPIGRRSTKLYGLDSEATLDDWS